PPSSLRYSSRQQTPSHLARDYPVSFSLDVLPAREDAWDRDEIVRGFWVCPDSASRASRVRTQRRVACAYGSNGADGVIRAAGVADARAVFDRQRNPPKHHPLKSCAARLVAQNKTTCILARTDAG